MRRGAGIALRTDLAATRPSRARARRPLTQPGGRLRGPAGAAAAAAGAGDSLGRPGLPGLRWALAAGRLRGAGGPGRGTRLRQAGEDVLDREGAGPPGAPAARRAPRRSHAGSAGPPPPPEYIRRGERALIPAPGAGPRGLIPPRGRERANPRPRRREVLPRKVAWGGPSLGEGARRKPWRPGASSRRALETALGRHRGRLPPPEGPGHPRPAARVAARGRPDPGSPTLARRWIPSSCSHGGQGRASSSSGPS